MGNCGSSNAVVEGQGRKTSGVNGAGRHTTTKAFQGTGHRLGAANEEKQASPSTVDNATTTINDTNSNHDVPSPIKDPNLSDSDRQKQREARLAAAEKRQQTQISPKTKKKQLSAAATPLRGPNSEPLMRWQAG